MPPAKAFGSGASQANDVRVQNQVPWPLPATQTRTGLLSVTVTGTGCSVPCAQLGVQSSSFSVPVPTAAVELQVDHVMCHSETVESPDSTQPDPQAGACSHVPVTDPPSAR